MNKDGYENNNNGFTKPKSLRDIFFQFWRLVIRRKWTILFFLIIVTTTATIFTFSTLPIFVSKGTLLIEKEPNILTFEEIYQIEPLKDDFLLTQINLLYSRKVAQIVVNKLKLYENTEFLDEIPEEDRTMDFNDPIFKKQMVDIFLDKFSVSHVEDTRLVNVYFKSHEPKLGAQVVNTFLKSYIDWDIETRFSSTELVTEFLSGQINNLRTEIQEKEQQLQNYGAKSDIFMLNDNETTIVDKLSSLNKALLEAQIERVEKQTYYNEIQTASPEYIPESMTNSLIQRLREDYLLLKREYLITQEKFGPEYPAMKRLDTEINSAKLALDEEMQNLIKGAFSDYRAAQEKENSLIAAFDQQKNEATQLNNNSILYNSLNVEIQNSKNLLESLMKRQSETRVTAQLKELRSSSIKIINEAEIPMNPDSPNKKLNLMLALMVGFGGGVGLAFLFESLDGSIKSRADLDKYTNLPMLGVVPKFCPNDLEKTLPKKDRTKTIEKNSIQLISHNSPESIISESYRTIRTFLLSTSRFPGLKTLAISSSLPDEGKTTTATNLDISLAQLGKKVILIDADLRKPDIHKIFKIENTQGLSDCLTSDLQIMGMIKRTPIPNLFIINSGSIQSSPSEILGSEPMREFTDSLKQIFDFILFDVPPILSVTDATAINANLDGMVLVVKGDKTPGDVLKLSLARLELMDIKPLGIIINNINIKKIAYEDRHGYYSYRYGKGFQTSAKT